MKSGLAPDPFLDSALPLRFANAVAALLVLDDGRYVMQLRDQRPDIFYPGHWGCFGGAIDATESPIEALHRELLEELELRVDSASEFTQFDFDLSGLGQEKVYRIYYEIPISESGFRNIVLHEGAAIEAIEPRELLLRRRVTPYDAFAVWMHHNKSRFAPQSTR